MFRIILKYVAASLTTIVMLGIVWGALTAIATA